MMVHFHLNFHTRYGEQLTVVVEGICEIPMTCVNEQWWLGSFHWDRSMPATVSYYYQFKGIDGGVREDWDNDRRLDLKGLKNKVLRVFDQWNDTGDLQHAWMTQPFSDIFFSTLKRGKPLKKGFYTHEFRVKAPALGVNQALCLVGSPEAMGHWGERSVVHMHKEGPWYAARLDLSDAHFPVAYKYAIWDVERDRIEQFEDGDNRVAYAHEKESSIALFHDGFARIQVSLWRGAGVAIPVFSLRSEKSYGIGEFTDLVLLADWAAKVGLRMIQLLPFNDTTATRRNEDSYPYAAISAFALHPIYLNPAEVAGKEHAALLKPFEARRKKLNALPDVDYEGVIQLKWDIFRKLYEAKRVEWAADPEYQVFLEDNREWLMPYAAFCALRDRSGTVDFSTWGVYSTFKAEQVAEFTSPGARHYDEGAIHLFIQFCLHRQLKKVVSDVHSRHIAVKGDVPIGIYRHSCDAWQFPERYHMDMQAGAPPDDFAVAGQNWGFPTYNWSQMQSDNFSWWRMRFAQMSRYTDAFRIDHILGFFRIWSIPMSAVQGILGHFVPALPLHADDLRKAGISFEHGRFCRPYITSKVLESLFGPEHRAVADTYMIRDDVGHFAFRPGFETQAAVVRYFEAKGMQATEDVRLMSRLLSLHAEVLLIEDSATPGLYHPRIALEQTNSFAALPEADQRRLKRLSDDYFYRRQDAFWASEAMKKLPALKRATRMLVCGEDLGMVPHCVPGVMKRLGILSLEIQRMPKQPDQRFAHPKDAPYLSVVTPSTHDMSTLRGWWEEDCALSADFFRDILGQYTPAPYFCEPWVCQLIIRQHLDSPAMWSIFQLQDLLAMDGTIRRENPHEERINIPADPNHYWRYRMHMTLEELAREDRFNQMVRTMIQDSGRV
jgi:4-alpha-glucanotransferase